MKLLILETKDPYLNLAVEEYLFRHGEGDIFLLWQNEPTVVIGRNQNAYAEVDMPILQERGIRLARRITGGGAVYHDLGNVNYSFIADSVSDGIDFAFFTAPVLEALRSLGIDAVLSGRNDLLAGDKKFSGNAQYSHGGRTLHHGTLLFDSDLEMLSRVLRPDEEKIKSKAVRSVRSRVTNLLPLLQNKCQTGEFVALLAEFIKEKYHPEILQIPTCDEIAALRARNASEEWLYPRRDLLSRYTAVKKMRYPFGSVCACLQMSNRVIKSVTFSGDFFATEDISALETLLVDVSLDALEQRLSAVNVGDYIHGMQNKELIVLLQKE